VPRGEKATPTRLGPATTSEASPSGRDADQAAAAVEAGGEIDVSLARDGQALRTAEAAIPGARVAVGLDGPDGVVGGERRGGDEERAGGVDGEVIGGDAGLERGVDEDLALGIDLEDGAAAVADEEIAVGVKGRAGGDAHAFGVDGGLAGGVDAVDVALGARGDEEVAVGIEGQAGGVEDAGDEGSGAAVGADAHDGDGRLLAARAGDGGVDHAGAADGGAGDGMQAVGELAGDAQGGRVAGAGGVADFNEPGGSLLGTRKTRRVGRLMRTWAGWPSTSTAGKPKPLGPRWAPISSTSPLGRAAAGRPRRRCAGGGFQARVGAGARHSFDQIRPDAQTRCAKAMLHPKHTGRRPRHRRRCPSRRAGAQAGGRERAW
jgi:hypothetical protein